MDSALAILLLKERFGIQPGPEDAVFITLLVLFVVAMTIHYRRTQGRP